MVTVFVGLSQVAQGQSSALRFFEVTNPSEAVGFFANRNHFAALLYALILFAAAWAVEASAHFRFDDLRHNRRDTAAGAGGQLYGARRPASAQAMARSRAGLGLTILALVGGFALAFSDRRGTGSGARGRRSASKLLGFAVALALLRHPIRPLSHSP